MSSFFFFFFFQAEDGIRARNVTGVQTCALPILVRISGLHQKQSHWTIENDLYGTPEKLAACRRFYESRRRPKKANRFLHNWFNREAQPGKGGGDGKKLTGDALTHANLSSWTPPVRPFGSSWLRPAKCILNKSPRRLSPSG